MAGIKGKGLAKQSFAACVADKVNGGKFPGYDDVTARAQGANTVHVDSTVQGRTTSDTIITRHGSQATIATGYSDGSTGQATVTASSIVKTNDFTTSRDVVAQTHEARVVQACLKPIEP